MMKNEIEKQINFLMEIDKSKGILRMNWMLDQSRREDDAQHAWHACLTAMVLQKYAVRPVDIGHVVQMLLVHDIVVYRRAIADVCNAQAPRRADMDHRGIHPQGRQRRLRVDLQIGGGHTGRLALALAVYHQAG